MRREYAASAFNWRGRKRASSHRDDLGIIVQRRAVLRVDARVERFNAMRKETFRQSYPS